MLGGLLAARVMGPLVPVTLELDVHLYRPAPRAGTITGRTQTELPSRRIRAVGVLFLVGFR